MRIQASSLITPKFRSPVLILLSLLFIGLLSNCSTNTEKVLLFTKTAAFRHGNIEKGVEALQALGVQNDLLIEHTEDATLFTEDQLAQYSAVIFFNTTGDVLNDVQQADFERYIQAGGGYVGIHAATDTEYDWPWYHELAGAYFVDHPDIQEAKLLIKEPDHLATASLESEWVRTDEWYNFRDVYEKIEVLIEIDESSYKGGSHKGAHPMSWYHSFDGGRAFYTGMGHTEETFKEPQFLQHLLGGIQYAIGDNHRDYSLAKTERIPEENRFTKEVLDFNLDEPMELAELPGKGILFIERRGALKFFDFEIEQTRTIGNIDVKYQNEDGLIGLAVDPDYKNNHWIYLFYSPAGEEAKQHISRFTLKDEILDLSSEKIILEIPLIRECCHSGGSLEFAADGLLYIGVGDNTNPFESDGYAPIDERPGRALWDAQKSASNTNDLRGKILRIKVEADGSYSIPAGNLFPKGTANTRPEIYVMGCRNPFRFTVDNATGYLYWGDIGPDAGKDHPERGPRGMGEFNQAKKPGYYGWPYMRGNQQVYHDYDFEKKTSGDVFDLDNLINNSPYNTGLKKMPPVESSMIWYGYDDSEEFPWLGNGGVNPMLGPIFHATDFSDKIESFPAYFEGKVFVYEWMRHWIYVLTLDENQDYVKATAFMPSDTLSRPMDMCFGSDGQLYILEYGDKWNVQNMDARLIRIKYRSGNRPPLAKIKVDKSIGPVPLKLNFSAADSKDYDQDRLTYAWSFTNSETQSTAKETEFIFTDPGFYDVELTVTDEAGERSTANKKIMVGNEPPQIDIVLADSALFYWTGKSLDYKINIKDVEDEKGEGIDPEKIKVSLNYLPEGMDMILPSIGHQQNFSPPGKQLMDASDCKTCHAIDKKISGPSYTEIAVKYEPEDRNNIISRIIKGSSGIWGGRMMTAHSHLSLEEAGAMTDYILSLDPALRKKEKTLPLAGRLNFTAHDRKDLEPGVYVLLASYQDRGNAMVDGSNLTARKQMIFRAPVLEAEAAEERSEGYGPWVNDKNQTLLGSLVHNSYIGFKEINWEGLRRVRLAAFFSSNYAYAGRVELRKGAIDGPILGQIEVNYFDEKKDRQKVFHFDLKPQEGQAKLFLVFRNPENKEQFVLNANWLLLDYEE